MHSNSGRYHNSEGAAATATEGSEEVHILARTGGNKLTGREYNFEFENLVCCQSKVMTGESMTTSLDVASNSTDRLELTISNASMLRNLGTYLGRATNSNVVMFGHKGVYFFPDISASHNNCSTGPVGLA